MDSESVLERLAEEMLRLPWVELFRYALIMLTGSAGFVGWRWVADDPYNIGDSATVLAVLYLGAFTYELMRRRRR